MKTGIELIAEERERQIKVEGWTPEHDDMHTTSNLADAAGVYALTAAGWEFDLHDSRGHDDGLNYYWPEGWEFKPKDQLQNLVRAGALIAAEIDRLQRKQQ